MRIYFDTCALLRLTDNQQQQRIRQEAQAVENILEAVETCQLSWLISVAVQAELLQGTTPARKQDTLDLLDRATALIPPRASVFQRAKHLRESGYGQMDALHLAFAEQADVGVLLTTDDRFFALARRGVGSPQILLMNPVDWWPTHRERRTHDVQQ